MSVLFQNFILTSKLNRVSSLHDVSFFGIFFILSDLLHTEKNESSGIHELY